MRVGVIKVAKKFDNANEENTKPIKLLLNPNFLAINGYKGASKLYPTSDIIEKEIRISIFEDIYKYPAVY